MLISAGPQTVLALSRKLKTGRTKLYPLLSDLVEKQLIVVHERHYGTSYEALPTSSLEFLVVEAEHKAEQLRSALPAAVSLLGQLPSLDLWHTKVVEYRGIDGLKQVNWNLTKAQGKFLVFEQASLDQHENISHQFAEKLRQIWAQRRITSYDITNDPSSECHTKCLKYKSLYSKIAYISPEIFKIQLEVYIYNHCVTLVKYEQKDVVAVEIYNDAFRQQQEQLFWLVWKMAKVLKG